MAHVADRALPRRARFLVGGVALALAGAAVVALRAPSARATPCNTYYVGLQYYRPSGAIKDPDKPLPPDGGGEFAMGVQSRPRPKDDPAPTTPTDPTPPPPAPPPTPTTPPAPTPQPSSAPTTTAPSGPEAGRSPDEGRRGDGSDLSAWEVWWAIHRFEFLAPADHSADLTDSGAAKADFATTRAAVRPRLLALVRSSQDYRVRGAALAAAMRIATTDELDAMAEPIREALRDHNIEVAMTVANALSYTPSERLFATVHPVAKDENVQDHVRGLVALALPGIWSAGADPALVALLRGAGPDNATFSEGAILALGATRGPEGTAALEQIAEDASRSPVHRGDALTALARRGLDARERIAAALGDRRVEVRRAAAAALGILPWSVVRADAATVASLRDAGNADAAEALEEMVARLAESRADALRDGPARAACVRLARVLLDDRDKSVRAAAAMSLGRIARSTGLPLAAKILLLDLARTRDQREYDLLALGISRDPRGIPPALDALRSPASASTTRAAAALALGLAGATPMATALATTLSTDPNPEVRGFAALALGLLHEREALPSIRGAFARSKNVEATANFAIALGLFGEREDVDALTARFARGGNGRLLFNLVEALRLAARPGAAPALATIAEDRDSDAAPQAIDALASVLAPSDGGKCARATAFDHLDGEDYLLAYFVTP